MTIHKQIFKSTLLLVVSLVLMSFKTTDERAAEALARRVMGSKAKAVVFEQYESPTDSYELLQKGKKVLIRGNNANSMAVGLNRYIQQYCLANVSWYDYNPVELPRTMPKVPEKVKGKVEVPIRFFLNYCTFGYTMPWWKWQQWERFIDWMALNGVNMPLAITGQEAVWQKVWRKYGMTDEQIRAYFTGPAHLPWQRMINIDRWQGPLPQSWIDGQAELQKQILKRERELNMTPVLPAFAGHIPADLEQTVPGIRTSKVNRWCNFDEKYRCTYLNPQTPSLHASRRISSRSRQRCMAPTTSTAWTSSTKSRPHPGNPIRWPRFLPVSINLSQALTLKPFGSRWLGSSSAIRKPGHQRE